MTGAVQIGDATLYLGDCLEILPTLGKVDAVVTDPPYGMGWNTDSTRFTGGTRERQLGPGRDDWGIVRGDDKPFDPSPWLAFQEVILWGANHYAHALPVGTSLVWLKRHLHLLGTYLSDAEIAWQRGGRGVYVAPIPFPNVTKVAEGHNGQSLHPTQKPIALMDWCLKRIKGQTVLDPFMGSGTTGLSCAKLRRKFIGIEIEPKYFEIACKRIEAAYAQPNLFAAPPKAKPQQDTLI